MPAYNGNDDFFSVDGVDLSNVRRQIDHNIKLAVTDVSAGSGITWQENAEGLRSAEMTVFIAYPKDSARRQQVLDAVQTGTKRIVWGPEGNAAGKPKWECDMILTGAPTSSNHAKDAARGFNVSMVQAEAPICKPDTDTF